MSEIGKPERLTQNRIVALFRGDLGYSYLGDWTHRLRGKDGDSSCETVMSDRENVPDSIHITVMNRAAITASPFSYSQTRSTFRTAGGFAPAARASLGCVRFVDYLKDDTGLMALVFQHRLQ